MYLGIDAGGTHTDAVLLHEGTILAAAKAATQHDNLPASVRAVLGDLPAGDLRRVRRVTLGTTLAVNALVQGKADAVGLVLSAGPGLAAQRFGLGDFVHVLPGGLDHRGVEVEGLDTRSLGTVARQWTEAGVGAFAAVGKFSVRNPAHEQAVARLLEPLGRVTQGHSLSGLLNFPRRVAGAWCNSAVWRLHQDFLDAVQGVLDEFGVEAEARLLKADGGAAPLALSRRQPVDSLLSGPAASVMGVLALCEVAGDSLLLDMGGTTTDVALFAGGSPVLDREGMLVRCAGQERRTSVRSLATRSLGVGGDSLLTVHGGAVRVGPQRVGPALAFGGGLPTLLDALNVLEIYGTAGEAALSRAGVEALAVAHGMTARNLAQEAVTTAVQSIKEAAQDLLRAVNASPVYTLVALLHERPVQPTRVWLVGGPAKLMAALLQEALQLPVTVPEHSAVANAVGAALTLPTAQLELFADTMQGMLHVPFLDISRQVGRNFSLDSAQAEALALLRGHVPAEAGQEAEMLEAEIFATLDERGRGGRDIRVRCQFRPGIVGRVRL